MLANIVLALFATNFCCTVLCQEDEVALSPIGNARQNLEEEKAGKFLEEKEELLRKTTEQHTFVEWNFESNINDETEKKKTEFQVSFSKVKFIFIILLIVECNSKENYEQDSNC